MDLLKNFIDSLYEKISKRSELVVYVADVLCIERESAYRRLSGKVQFTIQEMGKLSQSLGISLDKLIQNENDTSLLSFKYYPPRSITSINQLTTIFESNLNKLREISCEPTEYGLVFSSLPMEFTLPYEYLNKFMYYKWGYFHTQTGDYKNYSSWVLPESIKAYHQQLMKVIESIAKRTYIWNPTTIWNITRDISYFKSIHAINESDINSIKTDLHAMLDKQESIAEIPISGSENKNKAEVFVSYIDNGSDFYYMISKDRCYIAYNGDFISSGSNDIFETNTNIREWIKSMKKISTLISESGERERRLFFEEQHRYIREI